MFLALNKKIMWMVVIWFAILQTVSPFIHGHLSGDSPAQGHGLHIHTYAQVDGMQHTLHSDNFVHTIGVDEALLKNIDLLPSPLFAVLFALFLFAATTQFFNSGFIRHFKFPQFLRTQSRPRAPPLSLI